MKLSQIKVNKDQLSNLEQKINTTDINDNDIEIIIGDFKNIVTTFNSKLSTEQNIILHKYVDRITVNTLNNIVSIFIKIINPSTKNTKKVLLLEKVLYGEYRR